MARQHFVGFSILIFMCALCLRCSHQAVWVKKSGHFADVLCHDMPPSNKPCLECLTKMRGTVRCGQHRQQTCSSADLCCNIARLRDTTAATERKSLSGTSQRYLIMRTATRRKRYKCTSLDIINVGIQYGNIIFNVSDMPVSKGRTRTLRAMENCTSLITYQAIQFPTSTSNNEYRSSVKKLHSSTLLERLLNPHLEIKNLQNFGNPIFCLSVENCFQTFSCQKFNVSSQTQNVQQKYTTLKRDHRRKKRSPNGSNSRENPSEEEGNMSRRNRQNNNGMTTYGVNHVVTTQENNHADVVTTQKPTLLNETLFYLLRTFFPQLNSPESADHLYTHHYTLTEKQHTSTEHSNSGGVSTAHDPHWTHVEGASTSPRGTDLDTRPTITFTTEDVTVGKAAYTTARTTLEIESFTNDNLLTDPTPTKYSTDVNTRAHLTGSATFDTTTHAPGKDAVTNDVIKQQSTTEVPIIDITIALTTEVTWNKARTEETTGSTMGHSTTNTSAIGIVNNDVVRVDNTINDVTTPPVVTTGALVTTVSANNDTAEANIVTDPATLAIPTSTSKPEHESNDVTNIYVTSVSVTDFTTSTGVAKSKTNKTTDVTTPGIATSADPTIHTSATTTALDLTSLAAGNVATMAETTDSTTVVTCNEETCAKDTSAASTVDRRPTNVQTLDVSSTEIVTRGSVMDEVTPDSRPYGVIEDTTAKHPLPTNMATLDFTAQKETTYDASASQLTSDVTMDNSTSQPTSHLAMDTSTSQPTSHLAMDTSTSHPTSHQTMDTSTSQPTSHQTMDTSTSQPTSQLAMDTSTSQPTSHLAMDTSTSRMTRPLPTFHMLGIHATTRRASTKVTTTATFSRSNSTSTTPDSVASDITNTMIGSNFQCSRSSGVACFLETANRSLHGETTNITQDQLMDACEVLMDSIQSVANSRSNLNSTHIITSYFQVLDTFLSVSVNSAATLRYTKRLDNTLTKVTSFVDHVMQWAKSGSYFHQDIQLTLPSLDLLMLQLDSETLKGRQLNLRSVTVNVVDIHNFTNIDSPANASAMVTAVVLNVAGAEVSLINPKAATKAVVSSLVLSLSAAVGGDKVSLIHTFSMTISQPKNLTYEPVCGFQSQNESETFWDTQGCQLSSYMDETSTWGMGHNMDSYPNLTEVNVSKRDVVCRCNHTTNFAILMQVVDFEIGENDELALSIITYLGCSVTLITQVIAITVFTCIRSLNSERVCVHRNLCISIMAAQITFISGIKAVQNKVVCAVVAVFLHYFYTSSFMWMLVEGLHLYNMIINVFGTERSRIVYYTCIGYGLPLLLVSISAVVDWEGYGTKYSCWLSIHQSTIWAFVGPAMAIIIVNFVILAVVIRIVVTSARVDKNSNYDQIRAGIKATLLLLPLLGLTWVFGLAAVSEKLIIFQYLFAILNTLQGFFIFMLHCVFNTEVRQTLNRMREKRSLQKKEFTKPISAHDRPSSSDSRSSSSTYVTVRETVSSAFSRRTTQKQHEIARRTTVQKGKELARVHN